MPRASGNRVEPNGSGILTAGGRAVPPSVHLKDFLRDTRDRLGTRCRPWGRTAAWTTAGTRATEPIPSSRGSYFNFLLGGSLNRLPAFQGHVRQAGQSSVGLHERQGVLQIRDRSAGFDRERGLPTLLLDVIGGKWPFFAPIIEFPQFNFHFANNVRLPACRRKPFKYIEFPRESIINDPFPRLAETSGYLYLDILW